MPQTNEDSFFATSFVELFTTDSTNNYALNLLRDPKLTERQAATLDGTVVFAHEQTAGKGQRGKTWWSAPDESLQMSLIINPLQFQLGNQFLLSAFAAITVRAFFEQLAEKPIAIKWPNDIYFQDRKAGGILIENVVLGSRWQWAVIGIGLNINQRNFDSRLPNPVSLRQITGATYDVVVMAKELQKEFQKALSTLEPGKDVENLIHVFNQNLHKKGKTVRLKKDDRVFEAQIIEVTPKGQLLVHHHTDELLNFGEVIWLG